MGGSGQIRADRAGDRSGIKIEWDVRGMYALPYEPSEELFTV